MTPATIAVGGGRIGLGHRPKKVVLPELRRQGFTHVVTLLGDREGALDVVAAVEAAGLTSLRLPLENGEPFADPDRLAAAAALFETVAELLTDGAQVFVHCSAGIHRTGMVVNAFLIFHGHEPEAARRALGRLRPETEAGVTERRLRWGHRFGGPELTNRAILDRLGTEQTP